MSEIVGDWDVAIATPIGTLHARYVFSGDGQALTGTATGAGDEVELLDLTAAGARVTWRQRVRKPIRLNLDFDVTVDGDTFEGCSRAGRLPRSKVTATRVPRDA
ncbi:hypothetical protein [Lentzea xinjiangensis]|uniref:hypothetical protein n=1 Tax=Lentzea xinjiangensis TaxID=402600 RepID=UPI000A9EBF55|nr:hypothetical protein [Lentzea xinjiangensis]